MLINILKDFKIYLWVCLLTTIGNAQGTKYIMFNGEDIDNWYTQGSANWRVENGEIKATHDGNGWAHLLTSQTFTDCTIRLKYKVSLGNSGIYVRSSVGGCCGVNGMQFEAGYADGSAMAVYEDRWEFLPGNPVYTADAPFNEWNEMIIELEGQNFTSYVNGVEIMHKENIPQNQMAASGSLSFQIHVGENNEAYYKDIEIFTPRLIPGCMDSTYEEYNAYANEPDPSACKTLATVNIKNYRPSESLELYTSVKLQELLSRYPEAELTSIRGRAMSKSLILLGVLTTGIYFVKINGLPVQKILISP